MKPGQMAEITVRVWRTEGDDCFGLLVKASGRGALSAGGNFAVSWEDAMRRGLDLSSAYLNLLMVVDGDGEGAKGEIEDWQLGDEDNDARGPRGIPR